MTATSHTQLEELDSPSQVLVFARRRRADADRAEADVLVAGVSWAELRPPESIHEAAFWIGGGEEGVPLAGESAPLVAELCLAEFAAAIGRTTDSGKLLIAHGLELKYRLPRTWDRTSTDCITPDPAVPPPRRGHRRAQARRRCWRAGFRDAR
ncbi:MAG: endonuclease [Marmoricola sp.]|nr:endonuclease [Marmoricola sp.]